MISAHRRLSRLGAVEDEVTASRVLSTVADAIEEVHPDYDRANIQCHLVSTIEALWDRGLVIVSSADYLRGRPLIGWFVTAVATVVGFLTGLATAVHVQAVA